MMNYDEVFQYFERKLEELRFQHELNVRGFNPFNINSKSSLKDFIRRISIELFEETEFHFIDSTIDQDNKRVEFIYRGQRLYLEIDPKFGHIEADFFKILNFMAELSDRSLVMTKPTSLYVSGDIDDLKNAWKEGLPVHLPEINYRHRNLNGKYFTKDESRAQFIVKCKTSVDEISDMLVTGINKYLKTNNKAFRYNNKQIKLAYEKSVITCYVSGDYSGRIILDEEQITVDNGFEMQVLLFEYFTVHPKTIFYYKEKDGQAQIINDSFSNFISNHGRK